VANRVPAWRAFRDASIWQAVAGSSFSPCRCRATDDGRFARATRAGWADAAPRKWIRLVAQRILQQIYHAIPDFVSTYQQMP